MGFPAERDALNRKLIRIEEKLNRRAIRFYKAGPLQEFALALDLRKQGRTALGYILESLPAHGFQTKSGEPDWVGFYKYARIEPGVWSTFAANLHAPSKETLLKIVIGMRFSEGDAREFLSLAGSGFKSDDFRDQVILACMDCGFYDIEDVYAILEEYGGAVVNGKRRFKNIY